MLSILKRIFWGVSKKNKDTSPGSESNAIDTNLGTLSPIESKEIPKKNGNSKITFSTTEFKKEATKINAKKGPLAAINFIQDFIDNNNLEFEDLIKLLKKSISYRIKDKNTPKSDLLEYINQEVKKYPDYLVPENLVLTAQIMYKIDTVSSIEFLENSLGEFDISNPDNRHYYAVYICLANFYIEGKFNDKAFQSLSRASLSLNNFHDRHNYLRKVQEISELAAEVCINSEKKQYADYLHHSIVAFILLICIDANAFPHLTPFYHRKNICFKNEWGLSDDEEFDNALSFLKINSYKKQLIQEIYEFTFNDLPVKMGIPKKYFNQNFLKDLFGQKNTTEILKVMEVAEKLEKKPFNELGLIQTFASEVVKKYYDLIH